MRRWILRSRRGRAIGLTVVVAAGLLALAKLHAMACTGGAPTWKSLDTEVEVQAPGREVQGWKHDGNDAAGRSPE